MVDLSQVNSNNVDEDYSEQLETVRDEEYWDEQYFGFILKETLDFFGIILLIASTTFAVLNFSHGYNGSIESGQLVAYSVGILYFSVEYIIPLSAHVATITWSETNKPNLVYRFIFRLGSSIVFVGGMFFSWMILQGNFSLGSDIADRKSKIIESVTNSDLATLPELQESLIETKKSIKSLTKTIELQSLSRKWKSTIGCTDATVIASIKYCNAVRRKIKRKDRLIKDRGSLIAQIKALKIDMSSREVSTSSDKPNKVMSWITGFNSETIDIVKPTLLATIAAVITHIGWALKGVMSNMKATTMREKSLKKSRLKRQLSHKEKLEKDDELHKEYLSKIAQEKDVEVAKQETIIRNLGAESPLPERPLWMQVGKFIEDQCIRSEGLISPLGSLYEHYILWARDNNCMETKVFRFKVILEEQLKYEVTKDGRVIGVALKNITV